MTFEEFNAAVGEISLELPDELYYKLNGGIVVRPEEKLHSKSLPERPLYIAGEYTRDNAGRRVVLYYGSFMRLYGNLYGEAFEGQIRRVLKHELRHHWESLSGERGLEIEDADMLEEYIEENAPDGGMR